VGKEMRRRHEVLRQFLTDILNIRPKTADEEACMMEHALSTATLNRLADFMEFIQICPRTGDSWLHFFEEYRKHGRRPEICQARSDDFSSDFSKQVDESASSTG
jgi:DtxR family Mn-dependent transcriptional regulator